LAGFVKFVFGDLLRFSNLFKIEESQNMYKLKACVSLLQIFRKDQKIAYCINEIKKRNMSIKNISALVIVVLLTIIIMQNTDEVKFTILFSSVYMSKVPVMTAIAVAAFILGVLVGRPKNKKYNISEHYDELHQHDDKNTLSDEDRDYISRD
jgi:uncharacterized integral membrane protein